jgi:hypothetical protein
VLGGKRRALREMISSLFAIEAWWAATITTRKEIGAPD